MKTQRRAPRDGPVEGLTAPERVARVEYALDSERGKKARKTRRKIERRLITRGLR